jgi:DNA-binding NarL/FixJ family response regulator
MKSIRVAIVEDDPDLRTHFKVILENVNDFELVGIYSTAEDFELAFEQIKPNVVLMDINLPGKSGIQCIEKLKSLSPNTQYLICTIFEDSTNLFNALCAGATGYILKISASQELEKAVRDIHNGGSPMSPQIARYVIEAFPHKKQNQALLDQLSSREKEILLLLADGYRYKEIADQLHLGVDTIRTYIRNIYSTLQVHSRTDAINKAFGK